MSGAANWPPARAPLHPVASWGCLGASTADLPAIDGVGPSLNVFSARYALAHALRLLGIGESDRVLLPAYHCTAMVAPCVSLGATPVFYRVTPTLDVDYDDLVSRSEGARALVAVHYYGFPQDLARLRRICDERGMALIEDCAHAFFGRSDGQPIGSAGDFAIGSPWKFFPVRDGGCLVSSSRHSVELNLRGAGWSLELRAWVRTIETAGRYGRLRPISWLMALAQRVRSLRRVRATREAVDPRLRSSLGDLEYEPIWLDRLPSQCSRWIVAHSGRRRIVERRRENFEWLVSRLEGTPGLRLVHSSLPEDVVPYVLPVVFENAAPVFRCLKCAGVPVLRFGEIRWPDLERGICPVADRYSERLFQFPCHQELTQRERAWIASQIQQAAREAHG